VMSFLLIASMHSLPPCQCRVIEAAYFRYCYLHCLCSSPRRLSNRSFAGALLASLFYTPVLCHHPPLFIYTPCTGVPDHRPPVAHPRCWTSLWRSLRYLCSRWERGFSDPYLPFRRDLDHMYNVCTS
jgi:hypothetical protein